MTLGRWLTEADTNRENEVEAIFQLATAAVPKYIQAAGMMCSVVQDSLTLVQLREGLVPLWKIW